MSRTLCLSLSTWAWAACSSPGALARVGREQAPSDITAGLADQVYAKRQPLTTSCACTANAEIKKSTEHKNRIYHKFRSLRFMFAQAQTGPSQWYLEDRYQHATLTSGHHSTSLHQPRNSNLMMYTWVLTLIQQGTGSRLRLRDLAPSSLFPSFLLVT